MCQLSHKIDNMDADHIDISLMQNNSETIASGDNQSGQRGTFSKAHTKKVSMHTQEEEDVQLPIELENVLNLSTSSGSDTNSQQQEAHSINTATSTEGSPTSSHQSTVEHTLTHKNVTPHIQATRLLNHLNPDNGHHHHHNDDDQNMHVNSDASLNDSNSCNSSSNMFGNMLLNSSTPADECGSTPFFLSSRSVWPASSSSTLEEPASFFSSSIVNESLTPDLSLMSSTSMSRSAPTLDAENAHDQRTLPFFSDMETAANFHQVSANDQNGTPLMMSDSEYAQFHGGNVHSFSSFLAENPSGLPSEKPNHHLDFLGTGDGNGTGNECSGIFHQQMHNFNLQQHVGDVDHVALLQYQSAQSWHNALQQDQGMTEGAYACYLGPSQGMIPMIQGGTHTANYMLNAMELQQAAEQYYNAHQQGAGAHRHHLTHSHSLPLCLDQYGSTQQSSLQRIEIALNEGARSGAENFGSPALLQSPSSMNNFRGAVRGRINLKSKELGCSSGSSAMEVGEDEGSWAHAVEGHTAKGATNWRTPHHEMKGMTRHSNKRRSPVSVRI
ncbi:hypothetical protein L7F22_064403 [Adiantum nelumboides]|nr:hypothetical protein [Adiantum nelumboides]